MERVTSSKFWVGDLGEGKAAGDEVGDADSAMAVSTARQLFEGLDNRIDGNEWVVAYEWMATRDINSTCGVL